MIRSDIVASSANDKVVGTVSVAFYMRSGATMSNADHHQGIRYALYLIAAVESCHAVHTFLAGN
jgi:hypothetical protein